MLRVSTVNVIEAVYAWRASLRRRNHKTASVTHAQLMNSEQDYSRALLEEAQKKAESSYQAIIHARSTADELLKHRFAVLQRQIKAANALEETVVKEYEPFMFCGRNYMETMLHDLDFLAGCLPLARLLGIRSDQLLFNPLLQQVNLLHKPAACNLTAEQSQLISAGRMIELSPFLPILSGVSTAREQSVQREVGLLLQHCFAIFKQPHVWPPSRPFAEAKREPPQHAKDTNEYIEGTSAPFIPNGPLPLEVLAALCHKPAGLRAIDSMRLEAAGHEFAAECNDLRRYMRLEGELAWTPRLQSNSASVHAGGLIDEAHKSHVPRQPSRLARSKHYWVLRSKQQQVQEDNILRGYVDWSFLGLSARVYLPQRISHVLASFDAPTGDPIAAARFTSASTAAVVAAFSRKGRGTQSMALEGFQSVIDIASSIVREVSEFDSAAATSGEPLGQQASSIETADHRRTVRLHMSQAGGESDLDSSLSSCEADFEQPEVHIAAAADSAALELAEHFNARRPTPQANSSNSSRGMVSWFPDSSLANARQRSGSESAAQWASASLLPGAAAPEEFSPVRARTAPVFGGIPSPEPASPGMSVGSNALSQAMTSSPAEHTMSEQPSRRDPHKTDTAVFHALYDSPARQTPHQKESKGDLGNLLWATSSKAKLNSFLLPDAAIQPGRSLDGDDFLLATHSAAQVSVPEHMAKFFSASDAGIGSLTLEQLGAVVQKSSLDQLREINFVPGYDYHGLGPDSVEGFMNANAPQSRSAIETKRAHQRLRKQRPWHQQGAKQTKPKKRPTGLDSTQSVQESFEQVQRGPHSQSLQALQTAVQSEGASRSLRVWLQQEERQRQQDTVECQIADGVDVSQFQLRSDSKLLREAIKGTSAVGTENAVTAETIKGKPAFAINPEIESVMLKLLGPQALRDELAEASAHLQQEQASAAAARTFVGERASETKTTTENLNEFFISAAARLGTLRGALKEQAQQGLATSIEPTTGGSHVPVNPEVAQTTESIIFPGSRQPLEVSAVFLTSMQLGESAATDRPALPPIAKDIQRRVFGERLRVMQNAQKHQRTHQAIARCSPRTAAALRRSLSRGNAQLPAQRKATANIVGQPTPLQNTQRYKLSAFGDKVALNDGAMDAAAMQTGDASTFDGSTVRTKSNMAHSWSTALDTAQLGRQYGTGMRNSHVASKATLINFSSMEDEFAAAWSNKLRAKGLDPGVATDGRLLANKASALILPKL